MKLEKIMDRKNLYSVLMEKVLDSCNNITVPRFGKKRVDRTFDEFRGKFLETPSDDLFEDIASRLKIGGYIRVNMPLQGNGVMRSAKFAEQIVYTLAINKYNSRFDDEINRWFPYKGSGENPVIDQTRTIVENCSLGYCIGNILLGHGKSVNAIGGGEAVLHNAFNKKKQRSRNSYFAQRFLDQVKFKNILKPGHSYVSDWLRESPIKVKSYLQEQDYVRCTINNTKWEKNIPLFEVVLAENKK